MHGALILTAAAVIVKIIGALFKIPLTIILGGEGSAHFYTAYDIFNPVSAIAVAGLPVAVSKLIAESVALGRYRDVKKTGKIALLLFCVTGGLGFLTTLIFAKPFAALVGNPSGAYAVMAISPAVLFLCLMSAYRGYFEGLRNMYPTALSQITEAVFKLIAGYGIAVLVINKGMAEFEKAGTVFGTACQTAEQAKAVVLPWGAAGAVLGVTVSTACGFCFLALTRLKSGGIAKKDLEASPNAKSSKEIIKSLVKTAVPVCLGALAVSLTSTIDLASIMNRLNAAVQNGCGEITASYGGALPSDITPDRLPAFLFGTYKGLPLTIFHLVPAITTALGVSVLPAAAEAWAKRNMTELKISMESALRVTLLAALPAGIGMTALSAPILNLLYNFGGKGSLNAEIAVSTPLLAFMGVSVVFVAVTAPVNAMLQAIGRADLPVKFMAVGGLLKLCANWVLVSIPSVNIMGAPAGTILCYAYIAAAGITSLVRHTGLKLRLSAVFFKPLFASLCCGGAAAAANGFLERAKLHSSLAAVISMAFGAVIYAFILFLVKGIDKDDILMLPNGEKIAKTLEKHGIIG